MDNNPIDTSAFTHFLTFESLGMTTPHQVIEPSGFKDIPFSLKKKNEGFAREFSFIASGDKALMFKDATGEYTGVEQVVNPQGKVSKFLESGLSWILESRRVKGFEAKIKYTVCKDGLFWAMGYLSCIEPDTDGFTYFGCNIVQDPLIGDYTRQESTVINMFSTKDYRNQDIAPAPVVKFLRKSVPFYQESILGMDGAFSIDNKSLPLDIILYYNPMIVLEQSGIIKTLSNFQPISLSIDYPSEKAAIDANRIILAERFQKEFKFKTKLKWQTSSFGTFRHQIILGYGNDPIDDWTKEVLFTSDSDVNFDGEFTFDIPAIAAGQKVWFYFTSELIFAPGDVGQVNVNIDSDSKIYLSAKSVSIDTVAYGVWHVDMMKQASKFIRNVPVNAPKFEEGEEFHDHVCFNRSMLSQNNTLPFNTNYADVMQSVWEVCGDFENKVDEIFVAPFPDFYENNEIASFDIRPDSTTTVPYNPIALINGFKFGFKTFQDDSNLVQNSLQDVHTASEWIIPNEAAFDGIEREIAFTRSGYSQQKAADLEISKPSTSDDTDDDVYMAAVVPLPEGTFGSYAATLSVQVIDGKLLVRNKQVSNNDNTDAILNWLTVGLEVGGIFEIIADVNVGTYTIESITQSLLTLIPLSATPTETGDQLVSFRYEYSSEIIYQTQTDEGFDLIENIFSPERTPNLTRTIRRCMFYWESLLNTACSFVRDKVIRNTYFKCNGRLITQYQGGPVYTEGTVVNADGSYSSVEIPVESLQPRIISAYQPKITCYCTYEQAYNFLEAYRTTRGFIRAFDINENVIKGFVDEFEYYMATEELVMSLEEKFEEKILQLNYADGILSVFGTDYDLGGNSDWWEIDNGMFKAYDANSRPLCNWKKYDEVSLNGIIYNTSDELLVAITNL